MLRKLFFLLIGFFFAIQMNAQQLLTPSYSYSHKKTSYITLSDGSTIEGTLKDLDRKKGLIKSVKIEDASGKTRTLKPESIKFMYLPPSGLDNLSKAMDIATDAQKWNNEEMNSDLIKEGYVYFENAKVKIKKKEMTLMLQLLNPGFSKTVKVYHDPLAKETMSVGVAGVTVAGGDAKSYFVKVGDKTAFKLEKSDYKATFPTLFGKCSAMVSKYPKPSWNDFAKHITEFTDCGE